MSFELFSSIFYSVSEYFSSPIIIIPLNSCKFLFGSSQVTSICGTAKIGRPNSHCSSNLSPFGADFFFRVFSPSSELV